MRSPFGELLTIAKSAIARPRNDAPVPYVGRGGFAGAGSLSTATGDAADALEAPGGSGTLFAIQNQLSTSVAALEWHMHRFTGRPGDTCDICASDGDAEPGYVHVDTHPALTVWNEPNRFFTPALFIETFQQHLDLVGECWWIVAYLAGKPVELWPVRPDRMAPIRDPQTYLSGYVYRAPDGQKVPLRLDEVVFLRQPAPWDPYRGAGAVQTLLTNLRGAQAAAQWNAQFFSNSALPAGVIEMPVHLQDPEWEEFQQRWAESHRGVRNAHTVAMLEYGAKWVDTKYTQRDMEFSELRRANREEVREAFAIHGQIVGISENVNRANAEAGEYGFQRRLIVPRAERIKDGLNGPYLRLWDKVGMGPKAGYSFVYVSPVPADREGDNAERTSKAQAWAQLVSAGMNSDDAAQLVGYPAGLRYERPAPAALPPAPADPAAAGARA